MTGTPIILYDSKILVEFEGSWLELDAITELSGDTQITLQGPSRKSLFGHSPELLSARQKNTTSLTITTYITKNFPESIFFRMAGFSEQYQGRLVLQYPEPVGRVQPKANIYIRNPLNGTILLKDCFVQGLDIPFQKDKVGQLTITLASTDIIPIGNSVIPISNIPKQGQHMLPSPVIQHLGSYQLSTMGQSQTFQREVVELKNSANCFNITTLVTTGSKLLSQSNLGITMQEYVTKSRLDMADAFQSSLEIQQSGLIIRQQQGTAVKRLSLQTVPTIFWDYRATGAIEILGP